MAVVPLCQVDHLAGFVTLWLIVGAAHSPVRWLLRSDAVVTMCVAGLPLAVVPLWQVAHVPGATPVWFIVAGVQAVVRWQVSHDDVVKMWVAGLALAVVPLCQVGHVPGATPVGSAREGPSRVNSTFVLRYVVCLFPANTTRLASG